MKKLFLILFIMTFLTVQINAAKSCQQLDIKNIKTELDEIKADISFLNLYNALYLTENQMEALLEKLYQVEEIYKEADRQYVMVYWEVQDHYKKIRKVLMDNKGIPTEDRTRS